METETYRIIIPNGGDTIFRATNDIQKKILTVEKNGRKKEQITIEYDKIWPGNMSKTGRKLQYGERAYGHSVLLKLKNKNTYVLIQDKFTEFEAGNITTFYSYIGNSSVTYAYACDETYAYFFDLVRNIIRVPLDIIPNKEDKDYYENMYELDDQDREAYQKIIDDGIIQSTKYSFADYKNKLLKENIFGKIQNVSHVSYATSFAKQNIPNNAQGLVAEFLSGKKGTVKQQLQSLNQNYSKLLGGKQKTRRHRRCKQTRKTIKN